MNNTNTTARRGSIIAVSVMAAIALAPRADAISRPVRRSPRAPVAVAPLPSRPRLRPSTTPTQHTQHTGRAPAAPVPGVRSRTITVNRGTRGTISATVWYPEAPTGTWPIVAFSHGLKALPEDYTALATRWAAAGFVVVAPVFPNTNRNAPKFDPRDVKNQPRDVSATIDALLAVALTPGDALSGRLDPDHIIAAGHSGGAVTTVGLFDSCCRDERLRGGLVLAGNTLSFPGRPTGTPVPLLFVHGSSDKLAPYKLGQIAYGEVPWAKAFVTLPGEGHIDPYLTESSPAFSTVTTQTTDFLRFASGQITLDALRQSLTHGSFRTELDDHLQ